MCVCIGELPISLMDGWNGFDEINYFIEVFFLFLEGWLLVAGGRFRHCLYSSALGRALVGDGHFS